MKKILLFVLLALVCVSASARKSYITVFTYFFNGISPIEEGDIRITGDMPEGIDGFEYDSYKHYWGNVPNIRKYSTGEILNLLSENGYEVEFVNTGDNHLSYLLSKEIPSGSQTEIKGDVNKDGSVNISDISELVHIILDYVRANPSLLEESK